MCRFVRETVCCIVTGCTAPLATINFVPADYLYTHYRLPYHACVGATLVALIAITCWPRRSPTQTETHARLLCSTHTRTCTCRQTAKHRADYRLHTAVRVDGVHRCPAAARMEHADKCVAAIEWRHPVQQHVCARAIVDDAGAARSYNTLPVQPLMRQPYLCGNKHKQTYFNFACLPGGKVASSGSEPVEWWA
jgi:hypothetical protein